MTPDTQAGVPLVLSHLLAVFAAVLLLLIWVSLGARIRTWMPGRPHAADGLRWEVDAVLGAGGLATILFPLSVARVLYPPVVLGITAAVLLVSRRAFADAARDLVRMGAAVTSRADSRTWVTRAAIASLLLVLLIGAIAPPTEWDSLMYHLRIPLWLLDTGALGVPEDSFHMALVGASHFATIPLLAAGILVGPALMQAMMCVLVVTCTMRLAGLVDVGKVGSWLAGLVVIGSPMFLLVAITARVDVALVLALVAAHATLVDARARRTTEGVLLASVLVGIAMAIKPQAGAYAVALIPLGWQSARDLRTAGIAALVAVIVCAPWYLKNELLVGAPLYPQGAPGWLQPWLADVFGARVPPPLFDQSILRALPESRAPFNVLDAFVAPGNLTIEFEGAHYGLSPLLLLIPLVAVFWRSRRAALGVALVGVAYAAIVIVPFSRINLRYLMPAIPALAVGVAALLERAASRLAPRARSLAICGAVLFTLWPLGPAIAARFGNGALVAHAGGMLSARGVWRQHPDPTVWGYAPVIDAVERFVPEDGRVLMLWEARGLPFAQDMIADVMLSNWSYLAQSPATEDCLAGTGITHVLASLGSVNYYLGRGADPDAFRLGEFASFRRRCLGDEAYVIGEYLLARVRKQPD